MREPFETPYFVQLTREIEKLRTELKELDTECNKLTYIAERHRQNASERMTKLLESQAREIQLREALCFYEITPQQYPKELEALANIPLPTLLGVLEKVREALTALTNAQIMFSYVTDEKPRGCEPVLASAIAQDALTLLDRAMGKGEA